VPIDGYVDQESSTKSLGGVCAGYQPRHQGVRPSPAADVRGREIQADVHTRIRMLVKICNLIFYVAMCSFYFFLVYLSDGANGLPPLIPPNSSIYFDLTLLGFRPRCVWVGFNNIYALSTILILSDLSSFLKILKVKPLIQDEKTNEKPYHEELAPAGGEDRNNKSKSAIRILKDGDLASSVGDDNSSIGMGSLGGENRTSGSFAGTNRSSGGGGGGNKTSFSEAGGRASFGDGGNKTSFSNNNTSFRTSYNGK